MGKIDELLIKIVQAYFVFRCYYHIMSSHPFSRKLITKFWKICKTCREATHLKSASFHSQTSKKYFIFAKRVSNTFTIIVL